MPSDAHGVDFKDVGDSAAGYLTRIATEVVRADFKVAREGRLGPLQLLDLAGTPEEAWAQAEFSEYEQAVHGRHALSASKGLRGVFAGIERADLLAEVEDFEDDEAGSCGLVLSAKGWAARNSQILWMGVGALP
ncbi:MAG: hypothetical protein ACYDGN_17010 [Acidimicrobiales bacterium]